MSIKRLVIPLCAALALGLAACGSDDDAGGDGGSTVKQDGGTPAQSKPVTIAFSAPGADHGWMAAITDNARKQADELEGVTLKLAEGVTDTAAQADQIETLIAGKPDALVVLPNEGEALTPVALKAMEAGIPVINLDREFSEEGAYRTLITGDNYGIGYQAGNYFADELKCKGKVVEIQGIAGISVTEERSQGFKDALQRRCEGGIEIVASQPADFLPDKGLTVMENILQAQDQIDAVYTHDDDMAEGVVAAIENAGREGDMFLTGAGGSKAAMERIKAGGLYRATFLYNPSMSSSAINLARLIAQGSGMSDLAEPEVPSKITVPGHHGDQGQRGRGHGHRLLDTRVPRAPVGARDVRAASTPPSRRRGARVGPPADRPRAGLRPSPYPGRRAQRYVGALSSTCPTTWRDCCRIRSASVCCSSTPSRRARARPPAGCGSRSTSSATTRTSSAGAAGSSWSGPSAGAERSSTSTARPPSQ